MIDQQDEGDRPSNSEPVTEDPVTTRDRVWGWVVVVGVTVTLVAGSIWILTNIFLGPCCTRPAPGY